MAALVSRKVQNICRGYTTPSYSRLGCSAPHVEKRTTNMSNPSPNLFSTSSRTGGDPSDGMNVGGRFFVTQAGDQSSEHIRSLQSRVIQWARVSQRDLEDKTLDIPSLCVFQCFFWHSCNKPSDHSLVSLDQQQTFEQYETSSHFPQPDFPLDLQWSSGPACAQGTWLRGRGASELPIISSWNNMVFSMSCIGIASTLYLRTISRRGMLVPCSMVEKACLSECTEAAGSRTVSTYNPSKLLVNRDRDSNLVIYHVIATKPWQGL